MVMPLPTRKYDIVSWYVAGGIPPLYKIIENLGFEGEHVTETYKSSVFSRRKRKMIHKHKIQKGLTMVFYGDRDEVDFIQDGEILYSAPGSWHCHMKKGEIIREISLSKLI